MLAWAEVLGAEATTVTELLEEDNEEVGLCAYLVAGVSLRGAQIQGVIPLFVPGRMKRFTRSGLKLMFCR